MIMSDHYDQLDAQNMLCDSLYDCGMWDVTVSARDIVDYHSIKNRNVHFVASSTLKYTDGLRCLFL